MFLGKQNKKRNKQKQIKKKIAKTKRQKFKHVFGFEILFYYIYYCFLNKLNINFRF